MKFPPTYEDKILMFGMLIGTLVKHNLHVPSVIAENLKWMHNRKKLPESQLDLCIEFMKREIDGHFMKGFAEETAQDILNGK